jgi:hypothetical protein
MVTSRIRTSREASPPWAQFIARSRAPGRVARTIPRQPSERHAHGSGPAQTPAHLGTSRSMGIRADDGCTNARTPVRDDRAANPAGWGAAVCRSKQWRRTMAVEFNPSERERQSLSVTDSTNDGVLPRQVEVPCQTLPPYPSLTQRAHKGQRGEGRTSVSERSRAAGCCSSIKREASAPASHCNGASSGGGLGPMPSQRGVRARTRGQRRPTGSSGQATRPTNRQPRNKI